MRFRDSGGRMVHIGPRMQRESRRLTRFTIKHTARRHSGTTNPSTVPADARCRAIDIAADTAHSRASHVATSPYLVRGPQNYAQLAVFRPNIHRQHGWKWASFFPSNGVRKLVVRGRTGRYEGGWARTRSRHDVWTQPTTGCPTISPFRASMGHDLS